MLFLILAAALWGFGAMFRAPAWQRTMMISILWLAVVLAHGVLPAGNGIVLAFGGTFGGWLVFGGFAVLVAIYARWVRRMKARRRVEMQTPATDKPAPLFAEGELNRYARHIVLREIGGPGQKALKQARVLVVGAGGLGSPVLLYLGAAGVGTIAVVDDDVVDLSNLQRQVVHSEAAEGLAKVLSVTDRLKALNSHVKVVPHQVRLTGGNAAELIGAADVVLDGCDNFETRYLINKTCVALGKPLISGALSQWEGQISVFDPAKGGPCYQCIFPEEPAAGLAPSCAEAGVLSPLPGVVGAMMASEAIKQITGAGAPLRGEMLIYDALYAETRKIRLKARDDCPVCGAGDLHHEQGTP